MVSETSGRWTAGTAHTLAQFARRAGISEGRARALYAETPSGLPRPDRTDAGGRPLWWGATIDAWCASTGRAVSGSALWLHRAGPATAPPVELRRGLVDLPLRFGRTGRFFHILWDTPRGHVIYLLPLDAGGDHLDWIAHVAAELIEPRWWSTALVLMPFAENFPFDEPIAYVYRLVERTDQPGARGGRGGRNGQPGAGAVRTGQAAPLAGLRRWFARLAEPTGADLTGTGYDEEDLGGGARPGEIGAEWITHLSMEEIARPLGVRLPVWLQGTLTEPTVTRSLAYDRTFTVPDTTTGWPEVAARVQQAIDAGVPDRFPAGWALLAVDTMQQLSTIRAAHEQVADSGPGWYLVARPARPQVPVALEDRLAAIAPSEDMTRVAAELGELRGLEADTDRDDPLGELYAELIALLQYQLHRHLTDMTTGKDRKSKKATETGQGRGAVVGSRPDPALVAVHDDTLMRYSSAWSGAAIEVWKSTLELVDDPAAALRLRRVQRLLEPGTGNLDPAAVQIYRDPAGRYVVVHPPRHDEPWFAAEWPTSLAAVGTWTDQTMLVGDNTSNTTTLLALTPTPDGQMRVDPVPMDVRPHREAFGFGYGGGTPGTTCLAILRCALEPAIYDIIASDRLWRIIPDVEEGEDGPANPLWAEISAPRSGPLRLSWPQVQRWAHDLVRSQLTDQLTDTDLTSTD